MNNLSTYIIEKLKINKDSKVNNTFDKPVSIEFWLYYKTQLSKLEEEIEFITQIKNINLKYLGRTNTDGEKLLGISISKPKDLPNIYAYILSNYSLFGLYKDDFKTLRYRVNSWMIDNYKEIKDYLDPISEREIQEYLEKYT